MRLWRRKRYPLLVAAELAKRSGDGDVSNDLIRWGDRSTIEACARLLYRSLLGTGYKMIDLQINSTAEPVVFLFATGDRAEELRAAFVEVRGRHVPPSTQTTATAVGTQKVVPS